MFVSGRKRKIAKGWSLTNVLNTNEVLSVWSGLWNSGCDVVAAPCAPTGGLVSMLS